MNLLNGAYLNSENGTEGEYCYGASVIRANCNYTEIGIKDTYRSMIKPVTWFLGGHSTNSATADTFYTAERGSTVYEGRPTSTTENKHIGLMYPSDYGYSVLASSCARTTNLGSYRSSSCAGQSWLYLGSEEWTLTPRSSDNSIVFMVSEGLYSDDACIGYSVRPVLYLDSSVYVIDGNGTMSDPYIIGM